MREDIRWLLLILNDHWAYNWQESTGSDKAFVDSMNLNCHVLGFIGLRGNGTWSFKKLNDLSAYFPYNYKKNQKPNLNSLMS